MDAFQDLLTQSPRSHVSPELLEMLGTQAATMFTEKGVALNDGIVQLLADHPELGNEHIRRVIEFATNKAFQTLFEQGADKNVHFPVADPGVILRDAKDGGTPAFNGQTLDEGGKKDYFSAPPKPDQGDAELAQLFPGQPQPTQMPMSKVAAAGGMFQDPHAEHANPVENVYDAHVQMTATRSELATRNDAAESEVKLASADLLEAIKHEVLSHDGSGLPGVMAALEHVGGREKVAKILPGMIQQMIDGGVDPGVLEQSMTKTAGAVVNPNHPLVLAWNGLTKAAEQRRVLETALRDADAALAESSRFLRDLVK